MNGRNWIVLLVLVTAGCGLGAKLPIGKPVSTVAGTDSEIGTEITVSAPVPAEDAQTPEQLDTTTAQERAEAAAAPPVVSEVRLGTTIASLGDPTDPGFWAETGLVDQVVMGRLEYPGAGTSVQVELRPSGGSPGSGTRVSLPAMRVLKAPLTELPELVVFSG